MGGGQAWHCQPTATWSTLGRSVTDVVVSFLHDTEWTLTIQRVVSILTLCVQGAFDALLKQRLLQRLHQPLRLVYSFISDRRVRVRLDETVTDPMAVDYGTPQGSP